MSCKCYSLKGQEPVCGRIEPDSDYIFGCSSQLCGDCSILHKPLYGRRADEAPLLYLIMLILVIISTIVSILEA